MDRTTRALASLGAVMLASMGAMAIGAKADASPVPMTAHTKKCVTDVSTHDKQVPGDPIHLVNAVHIKWCPGANNTVTTQWAQVTAKSTNGHDLNCSTFAGVWTKFYFNDGLGTSDTKKVHVTCSAGNRQVTQRSPTDSSKRYKARDDWPTWTGYNQVAYYGHPQDFVWIHGHLNPFEVGHRAATLIELAMDAAAFQRVAGRAASAV